MSMAASQSDVGILGDFIGGGNEEVLWKLE